MARVSWKSRHAGYLSIHVEVVGDAAGPLWRRRWSNTREVLEWYFLMDDSWPNSSGGWNDDVDLDGTVRRELDRDKFLYAGKLLSLSWLNRDRHAETWLREFIWEMV